MVSSRSSLPQVIIEIELNCATSWHSIDHVRESIRYYYCTPWERHLQNVKRITKRERVFIRSDRVAYETVGGNNRYSPSHLIQIARATKPSERQNVNGMVFAYGSVLPSILVKFLLFTTACGDDDDDEIGFRYLFLAKNACWEKSAALIVRDYINFTFGISQRNYWRIIENVWVTNRLFLRCY